MDGREVELPEGEATIGRSRKSTLLLQDPSVSRHHLRLTLGAGSVTARDLGSSNGTYVNGRRLEGEAPLRDGDRLLVGETDVVVRIHPGAAGAAPRGGGEREPARGSASPLPAVRDAPAATTQAPGLGTKGRGAAELLPSISDVEGVSKPAASLPARTPRAGRPGAAAATFLPPAGFWIRLAASVVDGLWIGLVALAASLLGGGPVPSLGGTIGATVGVGLGVLVPIAGWSLWGTTPGKRLLRLYVCPRQGGVGIGLGRAVLRYLGYLLSALSFGLGFLMIGFTAAKRGLHDLVAGTYVGRKV